MKTAFLRPLLEAAVVTVLVLGALRWVTGLFSARVSRYRLTASRQLRLAFWPLLALGVGLSVVPAVATTGLGTSRLEWGLAAVFLLATLVLASPALLLHGRYWLLNKDTELLFQPKENRLEVYEAGQRLPFERRDIQRVERVTCSARRTFRVRYDYLRLHLTDGRIITLTSLLTELEPLTTFLRSVPTERRAVTWTWT